MKNLNKIIFIFVLVCFMSCLNVKAYDYTIDKFDIDIKVNEDNTFDIKETILANFNISKHGIYRTIPLENEVIRLDGTSYKNRARVSKVKVNEDFSTSRENGNYVIKIGDANRTSIGLKEYEINYHYNIGNDRSKDFDELYYNLIGTGWDTEISNVSFRITMPKEFDESKLGFSAGYYGNKGTSDIIYQVDGNVITGTFNRILLSGEALTVRLELPDGYFIEQKASIFQYLAYILPIIFLGVAILLWFLYGRDEKPIETIEFYPPEGKNSLEVGFMYKGKANREDVTSLLIYLANKGYIKIAEKGKKGFKITKVKDYDGNNDEELEFLRGLFKNSRKDSEGGEYVTDKDLYDSFYITMNSILKSANSKENKNLIYEKIPKIAIVDIIMFIITLLLITFVPTMGEDILTVMMSVVFIGVGIFYVVTVALDSSMKVVARIGASIIGLFFLVPGIVIISYDLLYMPEFIILFIIGLLSAFGILIFYKLLSKRNKYGTEILGKLMGFKTFLETAEKEKLEAMVKDNPTYFYDILPFTYVLGVSSTWIKKFEAINMEAPTWYYGPDAFDIIMFNRFMDNTMNVAAKSMSSSPSSSSSGGGFSGGGFSGGGSGGGGGGSW